MIANEATTDKNDVYKSNESAMQNIVLKNEIIVHRTVDETIKDLIVRKRGRPRKILEDL